MKLHYMGKYDLNPDSLPHGEHKPNAVPFREAKDSKTLALIANLACLVLIILLAVPAFIRGRAGFDLLSLMLGCILYASDLMCICIRILRRECCL